MAEIGQTGLVQWSGIIQEDFLRELRGREGVKRYNEMRLNSPVVGAMLTAMELGIRGVEWSFVTEDGNEEDERIDFLNEARDNMTSSWNDHITEVLTMLPFGWSYFETVYERVDSQLMWRKFAIRGQDTLLRWQFDDQGGIEGMIQQGPPTYTPTLIPIEKSILYRTRVEKNNPEGRSMLRTAWISYYASKNIGMFEGIGLERDLAGMPVIKLPEGATTDTSDSSSDASKAAKIVRNLRNDQQAGVVLPPNWELELMSTGGQRMFDTDKIISRYESRILMSMLSQFLILGLDRVGTQALSSDQTDLWNAAINAIADIISETFTKFAIPRLLRLNGMDPDGIRLEHSQAGDVDIMQIAEFFSKIMPAGLITWTAQDEAALRDNVPFLAPMDADAIEEEREREQERKSQIAAMFQPNRQPEGRGENGGPPPSNPPDQNIAELYASSRAPDDDERRLWERRIERLVMRYFRDQKERLIKGARQIPRG